MKDLSVILTSAGMGSRNWPINHYSADSLIPKFMLRVMGVATGEITMRDLIHNGAHRFYVVTKELDNRYPIQSRLSDGKRLTKDMPVSVHYTNSSEDEMNNGSGDGILRAIHNHHLTGDSVILTNDNLYGVNDWQKVLDYHRQKPGRKRKLMTILADKVAPTEDVLKNFGIFIVAPDGRIEQVLEKVGTIEKLIQRSGRSIEEILVGNKVWVNTAGYFVNNNAMRQIEREQWVIDERKNSSNFDMAGSLIKGCVERELPIYTYKIDEWADLGTNDNYLSTVEDLLSGGKFAIEKILESEMIADPDGSGKLIPAYIHNPPGTEGNVWIHSGTYFDKRNGTPSLKELIEQRKVKIGPNVFIGRGSTIKENAEIHHAAIEKNVTVEANSEITHSVIFEHCHIFPYAIINGSILGVHNFVYSSKTAPTRIEESYTGPRLEIPKDKHLIGTTVYFPYHFKEGKEIISNKELIPTVQDVLRRVANQTPIQEYDPEKTRIMLVNGP